MAPTVRSTLDPAIPALDAAGVDTPRLDAELLLAHVLGVDRLTLFAHPERPLTDDEAARFEAALQRRLRREPLPYITGTREFLGLPFRVTPAVLIPRPETEILVETVAARLTARGAPGLKPRSVLERNPPSRVGRESAAGASGAAEPCPDAPAAHRAVRLLDVGAGSGCIAVGLVHLLPDATVVAVEPSADALVVARQNAAALGVADRIEWLNAPFPEAVAGREHEFDAVVSNPPYIPAGELASLQPEVRDWEPREALIAGADGLALIRVLAEHAPRLLRRSQPGEPGGLLALEVAAGQAPHVEALLRAADSYASIACVPDLAGIPRVILARTQAA